jgi:hypothetical protein
MLFPPDLLTKLKKRGAAAAGFLKGPAEKVSRLFTQIREKSVLKKLLADRKRLVLTGLGTLLALLLFSLVAVLLMMNHNSDTGSRAAGDVKEFSQETPIAPEELFLPAEPDFLPGVMLERERRQSWTAEDAEPYWQDPLKNGEEPWRDQVEAALDELLEHVP